MDDAEAVFYTTFLRNSSTLAVTSTSSVLSLVGTWISSNMTFISSPILNWLALSGVKVLFPELSSIG